MKQKQEIKDFNSVIFDEFAVFCFKDRGDSLYLLTRSEAEPLLQQLHHDGKLTEEHIPLLDKLLNSEPRQ